MLKILPADLGLGGKNALDKARSIEYIRFRIILSAEFRGHGVAYCATCDGEFFTDKEVFVVGGGFAAAEESVFLTRYARHVTVMVRGENFTCAEATAQATLSHPKITVLTNTQVEDVSGDTALRRIRYRNSRTGEETEFSTGGNDTFGVFVFAGYAPDTDLVKGKVELDPQGYVITDRNQKTNRDGVYAAGDVCVKNLRQVVTAVGDGATAATELEKYAAAMQTRTGLHPQKPVRRDAAPERNTKAEAGQSSGDGGCVRHQSFRGHEGPVQRDERALSRGQRRRGDVWQEEHPAASGQDSLNSQYAAPRVDARGAQSSLNLYNYNDGLDPQLTCRNLFPENLFA